ncbi:TIGR04211 family SH3 domain-containing protein [Desulfoferrobacter suflitae]|uniref:TIGR04211 family SH3 domain-containing protein n=1 Tax=Desulfoferrobacter suflitae TaxID=2865782 RepID=UPI002164ED22|nr:TIGR04211 family SH3 domain-containing protein [Desulfoferrobacter suflitae]MCK8602267.1 TIGR04211 family SH3 domain-containing protein [Desulfoferrobacter suflitae]
MRTTAFFILCFILGVMFFSPPGMAVTTAYVTDLGQVNLRSGPGTDYRVVSTLSSGFVVEVLANKGGWSNVRLVKEGGESIEGWILDKYLVDQPPWAAQAKTLNASLQEQLACIIEEKNQLTERETRLAQELKETGAKLQELQQEYESLKAGSSDYLKLKEEYTAARTALSQAQENVRALTEEIDDLKLSQRIRWFIAGALVLLCGWVIGVIMGRYQRKRRANFRM